MFEPDDEWRPATLDDVVDQLASLERTIEANNSQDIRYILVDVRSDLEKVGAALTSMHETVTLLLEEVRDHGVRFENFRGYSDFSSLIDQIAALRVEMQQGRDQRAAQDAQNGENIRAINIMVTWCALFGFLALLGALRGHLPFF
jgi:hypothetical protein